jgi:transposase InsO family protein
MLVALDDFSGYVHVKPLTSKAKAFPVLKSWINRMEIQTGRNAKRIRTDNGGEWLSADAAAWQDNMGIIWERTAPYTSLQNGRVERANRSIQERMRALLIQRQHPKVMWPYSLLMYIEHTV